MTNKKLGSASTHTEQPTQYPNTWADTVCHELGQQGSRSVHTRSWTRFRSQAVSSGFASTCCSIATVTAAPMVATPLSQRSLTSLEAAVGTSWRPFSGSLPMGGPPTSTTTAAGGTSFSTLTAESSALPVPKKALIPRHQKGTVVSKKAPGVIVPF